MIEHHYGLWCALMITLAGCVTSDGGQTLVLRTVAKGAFSGITQARQEVIRNPAAWQQFWTQHSVNPPMAGAIPSIDFAKEMVIAVTMGRKTTGGYALEVTRAAVVDGRLKIWVQRQTPAPGAMTIQVLTSPFHLVAVPKSDLKAEFVEQDKPPGKQK